MWELDRFEESIAVIDELGPCITYGELARIGKSISSALGGRCLVACLCRNTIGSLVGYISFLNHRIVPMMLNSHLDATLRKELLDNYKPAFLWTPQDMMGEFGEYESIYAYQDYVLLKTTYDYEYPLYEDLALLLTTSGSTGSPKFVRQSYQNILANTKSIIEYLEIDSDEKPITTLPMNYTYGLSIINTHIAVGATILLTDKSLMQKDFWTFFKEHNATSFGGVPYTYEILKKLRFMRMELPSLKTMTQAGGKLSPELHEEYAQYAFEHGKKFVVMYGQCEATARMAYLPSNMAVEKKGAMGIAIPGGTFALVDAEGNEITTPHTTGELVYRGENVTLGYALCGEDLSKGDERNGILQTGDMAQFDEDGYFYIVGRKKRFLKMFGNRVNLDEIDRLVKEHFPDINCASAGIDDHMIIYITAEKYSDAVKCFVSEITRINPSAIAVNVIEEIPRNDSGKVVYAKLPV